MIAFAIATIGAWAAILGFFMALRAFVNAGAACDARERASASRRLLVWLGVVGIGSAAALMLPGDDRSEGGFLQVPIFWPVLPFSAWLAAACLAGAAVRFGQAWLALNRDERRARAFAGAVWVAAGVAAAIVFGYSGDPASIIRGRIALSLGSTIALIALSISATLLMIGAGRSVRARGLGRNLAIHAALIVGSIVFGIPFAWLIITSLKEDRDMASPHGIVWVPRVQKTVPYMDPQDPLVEGRYDGLRVRGSIIERLPDQRLKIDILRPANLRGTTMIARESELRQVPKEAPVVSGTYSGEKMAGMVVADLADGRRRVEILEPPHLKGQRFLALPNELEPVRHVGFRWQNYSEALEYLPRETNSGLVYLRNTVLLVILNVAGAALSSSIVAYAFSRMRFPGRDLLFIVLLSTMMLPAAVTLMPRFLIFRSLGWIDTLMPLWVPSFFGAAFNVFLLRQFFLGIPMELEDAAKIDGCSHARTFWSVMLPQIKPAMAVIAVLTFIGTWNSFIDPLIYISSPENMPVSYAMQLFQSDRSGEPGMLMAFATMTMAPVLVLFFFAQRYFIEGVTLSGLGGR